MARIADIFDHFPFAEDRYLVPARRAASMQAPGVAARALQAIVERSPHFFRMAKAAEAFEALNLPAEAALAFHKAPQLAKSQLVDKFHAGGLFPSADAAASGDG